MIADDPFPSELEQAHTALIRYPRFKELHQEIRRCQSLSKIAGEPQCMSLEGVTGAGKSTLVKDYAAAIPRCETQSGTVIPVFYAEIPSPATVKGTAAALLEQLGDPLAGRGTLWSMNSRLIHFIRVCEVELVILDEFSNLIDTETNHILATVSDWLKMLIKQTDVPFLVIGLDGKVDRILQANPQLSRLFAFRETLHPFAWDARDQDSLKEFAMFVLYTEKAVGMPLSRQLPRTELLYRLHYATDGVVGHMMNLMRYAALIASENGRSVIDLTDLVISFEKRIGKHLRIKINPFEPGNETFNPPADKNKSSSDGLQQKRPPSIAATLTTK
ncbi:MAG: TniB family NTP-binding protein [Anaerolineales bacterium]|nr:TniB family NTP-binding protein [Anaerolineales bacterium]